MGIPTTKYDKPTINVTKAINKAESKIKLTHLFLVVARFSLESLGMLSKNVKYYLVRIIYS